MRLLVALWLVSARRGTLRPPRRAVRLAARRRRSRRRPARAAPAAAAAAALAAPAAAAAAARAPLVHEPARALNELRAATRAAARARPLLREMRGAGHEPGPAQYAAALVASNRDADGRRGESVRARARACAARVFCPLLSQRVPL